MLGTQLASNARYLRSTLLAALAITLALGAPQVLARSDTGKSLAACKVKIATLIEERHRVKLDKVRASRLRVKVLFPDAPRQLLWCDNRGGKTSLTTVSGAPFTGSARTEDRVAVMEDQPENQL